MTIKQQRFADEYLIDFNATQAAIRAGYAQKTAYSQGQRMLKNVEVKTYIDAQLEKLQTEKVANAQEVMEYLTSVLRGNSQAEIVVVEGEGDGFSSAKKIQKAPDEKEKLKAAELLGKRYGIFTDKINIDGAIEGVVIVNDIPKPNTS